MTLVDVETGEVIEARDDRDLREWDSRVDSAEDDGIKARWEYGRALLERRDGRLLPRGLLDDEVQKTGKGRQELQNRMRFAERYPTEAELSHAVRQFRSWHKILSDALGSGDLKSSNSNEWYTPGKYVEAARVVMGAIDLDPASSYLANKTIQAEEIFTAEDDGLLQPWAGRVWVNPPYGGMSGPFVTKLMEEYIADRVQEAVLLVNANSTDASWFQPLWPYLMCFTDHRIDFQSPTGSASNSTHGSVFVYLGANEREFYERFSPFGTVVKRWQP